MLDRGNAIAVVVVLTLVCPMMVVSGITECAPQSTRVVEGIVCPEGTTLRPHVDHFSDSRGPTSRVRAECVDASGSMVGGDVYSEAALLLFAPLALLWGAFLVMTYRRMAASPVEVTQAGSGEGGASGTPPTA